MGIKETWSDYWKKYDSSYLEYKMFSPNKEKIINIHKRIIYR